MVAQAQLPGLRTDALQYVLELAAEDDASAMVAAQPQAEQQGAAGEEGTSAAGAGGDDGPVVLRPHGKSYLEVVRQVRQPQTQTRLVHA